MTRNAFVGFDSAWGGKAPGAVCYVVLDEGRVVDKGLPAPASFDQAQTVVERCGHAADYTLAAIDQPTMVPNATGMRPVERVAGSVKNGVQPALLSNPMFGRSAPLWPFLDALGAKENPRRAQSAKSGLHLIEVFPGLALPSLLSKPPARLPTTYRYNPKDRSKFGLDDWGVVVDAVIGHVDELQLEPFSGWARGQRESGRPTKADQDCLDALICLIVALKWRRRHRIMEVLGDWRGHIVTPLSKEGRKRVIAKACSNGLDVPIGCGSWRLHEVVLDYFDGRHYDAFEWLAYPNRALGGESPLLHAETATGEEDVIDLIGRLAHGIPT